MSTQAIILIGLILLIIVEIGKLDLKNNNVYGLFTIIIYISLFTFIIFNWRLRNVEDKIYRQDQNQTKITHYLIRTNNKD